MGKALVSTVAETEPIAGNTVEAALRAVPNENFVLFYMPEIIDGRNAFSPEEAPDNWSWLTAPSIRATGRTKAGTPVVVYAHIQNYFSNPDNVAQAVAQGLIKGAGIMPSQEFYRLVNLAEEQQGKPNQRAFLIDYNTLKRAPSGLVAVKDALKHPQTIPFIGGRKKAEEYLPRHEQFFGSQIGMWHCDDLGEQPVVRVLRVGDFYDGGLDADYNLDDVARFVGVRQLVGAEGAAPQKTGLESILMTLNGVIAPVAVPEARTRLQQAGYR